MASADSVQTASPIEHIICKSTMQLHVQTTVPRRKDYSAYTRHKRTTLIRPQRHPDTVRPPCGLPTAQAKAFRASASRTGDGTLYVYRTAFRPDKRLAPRLDSVKAGEVRVPQLAQIDDSLTLCWGHRLTQCPLPRAFLVVKVSRTLLAGRV